MDLSRLTTDDWINFEKYHLHAYNKLVKTALTREYEHLKDFVANSTFTVNDFEINRLSELKRWHDDSLAIDPNYFDK